MLVGKIAVIGAGSMGGGIAQLGVMAGYTVALNDIDRNYVGMGMGIVRENMDKLVSDEKITQSQGKEMLSRLRPVPDLRSAVSDADLVIETIFDDLILKKKLFAYVDRHAPPHAVLAGNTSSMSISSIAAATARTEQVVGMHFFNPVDLMKLVEIIYAEKSSHEAVRAAYGVAKKMGKVPVIVRKDSPAFIYDRLNAPAGLLLQLILEKGWPKPQDFDAVFKPYMPMMPFESVDYIGVDTMLNSQGYYAKTLSPDYTPRRVLKEMVADGRLGKKTGRGIYDWSSGMPGIDTTHPTTEYEMTHMLALQVNEATKLLEEEVVSDPSDIDLAMANGGAGVGLFTLAKSVGYPSLVQKCRELAQKFGIQAFEPTRTMLEGKIEA